MRYIKSTICFVVLFVLFGFLALFPQNVRAVCSISGEGSKTGTCKSLGISDTCNIGSNCGNFNISSPCTTGIAVDSETIDPSNGKTVCNYHTYYCEGSSCGSSCNGAGEGAVCGSQTCCSNQNCCYCGCKSTSCAAGCCTAKAATNLLVTDNASGTSAVITWSPATVGSDKKMTNEKEQQLYVGTDANKVLNRCPNGTGSGTGCTLAVTGLSTSTSSYNTGNILSPNTVYYYMVVSWNSTDCNKYAMAPSLSSCFLSPTAINLQAGQSTTLETNATGVANGTVTYSDEGSSLSFNPNPTTTYAYTILDASESISGVDLQKGLTDNATV